MKLRLLIAVTVVGSLALACGSDSNGDDKSGGDGDDKCKPGQTYEAVAKPFVESYCAKCHGTDADPKLRAGADDVVLDRETGLRDHGMHVFERAIEEEDMPPKNEKQPSAQARADFAAWLVCSGAKDTEHSH